MSTEREMFEKWLDNDWPLWRNDPSHPAVHRAWRAAQWGMRRKAPLAREKAEPVATVCLVGDRYALGHLVEVQLQLASKDAPNPKIGDRYYTHPTAPAHEHNWVADSGRLPRCAKCGVLASSV